MIIRSDNHHGSNENFPVDMAIKWFRAVSHYFANMNGDSDVNTYTDSSSIPQTRTTYLDLR